MKLSGKFMDVSAPPPTAVTGAEKVILISFVPKRTPEVASRSSSASTKPVGGKLDSIRNELIAERQVALEIKAEIVEILKGEKVFVARRDGHMIQDVDASQVSWVAAKLCPIS